MYSLGAGAIGFAQNVYALIPIFFVAVSGFVIFHIVSLALTARASTPEARGKNMGNFAAFGDIGRTFIPTVAVFVVVFIGWRQTFFSLSVIGLLLFCSIGYFLYSRHRKLLEKKVVQKNETYRTWLSTAYLLLKDKKLVLVITAGFLDGIAGTPVIIFLPFFLLGVGIAPQMLSIFIGAYFIGSLAGKTLLGRLADRIGSAKVFLVTEMCMAITLLSLAFLTHFYTLLALSLLLGLFTRGTTPVIATLLSEVVHDDHLEKAYAVCMLFLEFTAIIAPILLGIVADRLGVSTIFYIASFFAAIAAVPILFFIRENKRK